ncbi:ABC transporter permease [Clostridium massiliamazoniense]|uniref:ABC transporter permease n=1 Tax=Clostridium massiliamazoniense TaxID=1347366 RepID=UPI0006D7AE89|nr:ABC transporter permease [Clostridium massiliamazoniense]
MNILKVLYLDNINRMITKRRKYFALILFAPIIMLVIFSYVFSSGSSSLIKVGVINESNNISSKVILDSLKGNSSISLTEIKSSDVNSDLKDKVVDLVITIPNNIQQNLLDNKNSGIEIKTIGNNSDYKSIEPIINNTLINLSYMAKASNGNNDKYVDAVSNYLNKGVNIKENNLSDVKSNYEGIREFLGILIFFIFSMAIGGTKIIGDARKNNVYSRVFMAPVSKWQYFFANILSSLTVLAIQVAISLIVIKYCVKINLGISIIDLAIVLLSIGAFAISLELISMLLSKDDSAMLSNIIVWLLTMLGGLFVPIELFPNSINEISMFLPTRWAMQYIYNLQQGDPFSSVFKYIILILISSFLLFIGAAVIALRENITFRDI